jgi:hypothetical protein
MRWRRPAAAHRVIVERTAMIKALVFNLIFFLIFTFPATWLLMLFAGNVGLQLSYWGTLPLGILVSVLLATVATPNVTLVRE